MVKVQVIYKTTRLKFFTGLEHDDESVKRFLTKKDKDYQRVKQAYDNQQATLETVLNILDKYGVQFDAIPRDHIEHKPMDDSNDMIIVLGGDGTVIETSHYIKHIPVLAINSDPGPDGSVGYFCCGTKKDFERILLDFDRQPRTTLNRLEVKINDKPIKELVLNDILLAHVNPAATSEFRIISNGDVYQIPKNSGLIASTAAGSTAWIYNEGGKIMSLDSKDIEYSVRGLRDSSFYYTDKLKVHSLISDGKVYVDGPHVSYDFSIGNEILILQGVPFTLIGDLNQKRIKFKK